MKINTAAYIADNRTDRTIQAASAVFLALVLAMGVVVMAGYAAPWSPIGKAREIEDRPAQTSTVQVPEAEGVEV